MTTNQWIQLIVCLGVLVALAIPLGLYIAKVFNGTSFWGEKWLGWLERFFYRLGGINPQEEMDWKTYALAMVLFSFIGGILLYLQMRLQAFLPLNPDHQLAVPRAVSFNTMVSFVTNTNFQFYSGETTLSYLSQMALTVQNFISPAVGIAILMALIRGFVRKESKHLGNFWVDVIRSLVYILLPLSVIFSGILIWQGCPQTFRGSQKVQLVSPLIYNQPVTVQGRNTTQPMTIIHQSIALGPVASQEAIKMLGTNGGGYFNTNSAHPFENPTPLTDLLELLAILIIPVALCFTFGSLVNDMRQGWTVFAAMFILLVPMIYCCIHFEQVGNPLLNRIVTGSTKQNPEGNMVGKEVRFGVTDSSLWASFTTASSNGSVNAMLDSFTPMGGLVPMWLMMLGEVSFGGIGSGLYGMIVFIILTVFIAGLMVGRTPEYLGKKIQAFEMKMTSIVILIPPLLVLMTTAISVICGGQGVLNPGAHGFSEILYAFTSMTNNNGSAFAGLSGTTLYNLMGGIAMWMGRFGIAIPVLAMAGSLVQKKNIPESTGTLPTHTPLFVFILVAIVIIVGALAFIPALALGPIVEQLKMIAMTMH